VNDRTVTGALGEVFQKAGGETPACCQLALPDWPGFQCDRAMPTARTWQGFIAFSERACAPA
jgi:hypothetical protein